MNNFTRIVSAPASATASAPNWTDVNDKDAASPETTSTEENSEPFAS